MTRGQRVAGWLGLWTFLGFFFSTQVYLAERAIGTDASTWWRALQTTLPDWYLWGVLSLLAVRFTRRFRLDRATGQRHGILHFGVGLWFAALHVTLSAGVALILPLGGAAGTTFVTRVMDGLSTQFHWNVLTYWTIVGAVHAWEYRRELAERDLQAARLQADLAEAKLQALALQLQPHFLFNTLNVISELMHEDLTAADRMVSRLADLLRATLDAGSVSEIPLAHELELIDRYLAIQELRFRDRLRVERDIAQAACRSLVPPMILFPLVENAIRHGIARRPGRGCVALRVREHEGRVELEVEDDGPGWTGAAGATGAGARTGIGLANTRARLEHLYGSAFRFELENRPGGGLVARVALPRRERAA